MRNTRDEIIEALNGEHSGGAPPAVFTQTGTTSQMDESVSWPEANFDAAKMAELSVRFSRRYGFATAKVPFCITAEAEALGCVLDRGSRGRQPSMIGSPYRGKGCVPGLPDLPSPQEFVETGRCPLLREAASIVKKEHPELFVIGGCVDPFMVASQLVGTEDFLMGMFMDRDLAKGWVDAIAPLLTEQARLLSECTDDVQFIVMAAGEILPPEDFAEFSAGPVRRLISSAKGFTTIHSCGETEGALDQLASLGESGLSVESPKGPETVIEKVHGRTRLLGGVPAVGTLMQGTPEEIRESAKRYSDAGYALITPECGVPPATSDSNLLALSRYRE